MTTTAKQRFDETMERCAGLLGAYETCRNDDLLRSVVVMSVSALDMYASDRFMENFTAHMRNHKLAKDEIDLLVQSGVTVEVVLELLQKKRKTFRPFAIIRSYVENHFAKASRQSFEKINELYAYYGLPDIVHNALEKSKRKTLASKIRAMLSRRNKIVHEADYDGNHNLRKIDMSMVSSWNNATKMFVDSMNAILESRFGTK